MSNFFYKNDKIVNEGTNPDTGNRTSNVEYVPRNLPSLSDEAWTKDEFVMKALGIQVGAQVRYTKKGTEVRDLFATKVQGDMSPTGRPYPYKKIGTLFSGESQDAETGEITRWHSIQLQGEESVQQPAQPAQAPAESEGEGDKAEEAKSAVDSL